MPIDARSHLNALIEHTQKYLQNFELAAQKARSFDPIELDKFSIHCNALAEALEQTGKRAEELAGELLQK